MPASRFSFGTKAENLRQIAALASGFSIPPFFTLGVSTSDDEVLSPLKEKLSNLSTEFVIIRSSSAMEDRVGESNAGVFESIGPVPASDFRGVLSAVNQVSRKIWEIELSRSGGLESRSEVIVQEYVAGVATSGVVFSRDSARDAPYYVINYDDVSGLSDSVTSGRGEHSNRLLHVFRGEVSAVRSVRWKRLIAAVKSLEFVTGSDFLDVEFVIDSSGLVHIVQLRPLAVSRDIEGVTDEVVRRKLRELQDSLRVIFERGSKFKSFGQMPDWNPAEIIGTNPRRLARELYELCVTDNAWADGRHRLGYSNHHSPSLMQSFAGQPFIDVETSFRSFIPASMGKDLADKLVDSWLQFLHENPHLHDKVEFEVVFGEPRVRMAQAIQERFPGIYSARELRRIEECYRNLAKDWAERVGEYFSWVENEMVLLREALVRFERSPKRIDDVAIAVLACSTHGATPFSLVARLAFASKAMLLSLEEHGGLGSGFVFREQSRIRTVATAFVDSVTGFRGNWTNDMVAQFGHLRPGTYDLRSPRYADSLAPVDLESYSYNPRNSFTFGENLVMGADSEVRAEEVKNAMTSLDAGLGFDPSQLLDLFAKATAARESVKLEFTRLVSNVLEGLAKLGSEVGLSRDEVSHVSLKELIRRHRAGEAIGARAWNDLALEGKTEFLTGLKIRLPALVFSARDVYVAPSLVSRPNFFGATTVVAEIVEVGQTVSPGQTDVRGKIALIENADPGYDWIFSSGLSGLVTKHGGANSHMAIRCVELGVVAAIGVGEKLFEDLRQMGSIELDPIHGFARGK